MRGFLILLIILLIPVSLLLAQSTNTVALSKPAGTGKTYAVVVGISKYESTGIPQLEFAHKDAIFFADYLKSKAGGSVPEENIRLLVNESATYAAIYDALDWLLATCQKDDLVYFYFSGHGDQENTTIYNLGFLLSYNTPRTNYINSAVRIEDLNNIANTLSVKINAKVVLITDACHSGQLAGSDFRGTFLVGDQLRTVQNKEIRITSCAPNQLSAEDEGWGGGRGVFSFYLVNGLEGLADNDHDKFVTVSEIKNYLDSSLAADALLAQKAMKQSPVIKGNNTFKLAAVDNVSLTALENKAAGKLIVQSAAPMLAPLPVQPQTYFFNLLQKINAEEQLDFTALNKLSKEQIPFACLQMLTDSAKKALAHAYTHNDSLTLNNNIEKLGLLEKTLHENNDALNRFNNKLAVVLSDRGQEIINLYLEGDAAELERRYYYNSKSNGYDVYPQMFSVALKLTDPNNYLYQLLQVKLHYFSGIAARLKIPTVENPQPLIDTAMAEQKRAFKLEENAAYIQNELAVLSFINKDLAAAEKYFVRATQIAPQWVIAWSNLGSLYTATENFPKATSAIATAVSLKPDFQGCYISSGLLSEAKTNLLFAEENYRKSIYLNSRNYLPFERLGYVYMNTTQYERADSFFYEADKRKKGFHFKDHLDPYVSVLPMILMPPVLRCPIDTMDIGKDDVLGRFVWGLRSYEAGDTANAERKFKEVIALDKSNPLAFHYLGRILYFQKRWEEAAIIFDLAIKYYLGDSAFNRYCDSAGKRLRTTKSKDCIISDFRGDIYDKIQDHFFAGRMYDRWNHYNEAEAHYRTIIDMNPQYIDGYYLLWTMLEKMGRYKDAENIVIGYFTNDKFRGARELNQFYKRMLNRYPDSGDWYYKSGLFLYHLCAEDPEGYQDDKKKTMADTHIERYFIAMGDPTRPGIVVPSDETANMPGILESYNYSNNIIYPRTEGIAYLKMADSLLQQDDDAVADINYKIGDLLVWQGVAQDAVSYYKKSVDLKPDNANTRLKLVDICDTIYQFSNALDQLDSLSRRHEINFDKQVLLAKYYIHESRFAEAAVLLKDAQQIHPYKIAAITDLNGRLRLLSKQPKQALVYYTNYLAMNPADASTMYTIARINAQAGNSSDAWKWLEMAMNHGFRYGWVLQFDTVWDSYRKQPKWSDLQKSFPAKTYKNQES
jgi:predicted Zn-dependent protease